MKGTNGFRFETVTRDELKEVIDLLNRVTYNLLEKNIKQWEYPWDESFIIEDILNERLIAVKSEEKIIGMFSIKETSSFFNFASEENVILYVYRISVDINFQGEGIGALILDYCKRYGKDKGKEMYLDCWQGNEKLRNFYESHKLTYMGDYPEEDFFVSVYNF